MAIHFRFRVSLKVFQSDARGCNDACCEAVKSCHAGLDVILRAPAFFASALLLDALGEGAASSGVAATPCARAHDAEVLNAARTQKTAPANAEPLADTRNWCLCTPINMAMLELLTLFRTCLQELGKTRIGISRWGKVVEQQRDVNFCKFIGPIVALNGVDHNKAQNQSQ